MAFTYDVSTDRGKVRLFVYDIDENDYVFEDNEVDVFLEMNNQSIWLASANACRVLAVKASDDAFAVKVSTALEIDKKQVSRRFMEMANEYDSKAATSEEMIWEFVDSFSIRTSATGRDTSEYVGEV